MGNKVKKSTIGKKRKTRKVLKRKADRPIAVIEQSRIISFVAGIAAVVVIALLIFQYAQNNNYRQVLGKQTKSEKLR